MTFTVRNGWVDELPKQCFNWVTKAIKKPIRKVYWDGYVSEECDWANNFHDIHDIMIPNGIPATSEEGDIYYLRPRLITQFLLPVDSSADCNVAMPPAETKPASVADAVKVTVAKQPTTEEMKKIVKKVTDGKTAAKYKTVVVTQPTE